MENLTLSKVLSVSVIVLVMLNPIAHVFTAHNSAVQAIPIFKPLKYKLVNALTGDLLGVDQDGNVHGKGDHRKDHVCFYYHKPDKGIVMLESTSGLGFVSLDSEGNVILSNEHFSDEEEDIGSGLFTSYRRFRAVYDTWNPSSHSQVQLESEDMPGCSLSFDSEGVALNACSHEGVEATKFILLRIGC